MTDINFETIRMNPRRIYHCKPCEKFLPRKHRDVLKRGDKFFCAMCGSELIDKTDDITGQDLMEIVCI